jgi:PAS domain S-box-containing protein
MDFDAAINTGERPRHATPGQSSGTTPEDHERQAAHERGKSLGARRRSQSRRDSESVQEAAQRAFPFLAENVRDYAVFLLSPEGVITFWGEGARLMKWWTREEAEGGHLRMMYLSGGSEDGRAEDHLREARERGEYTGEGQRVRRDGSTFWAGVTLTALRDGEGTLLGFAKVARDLTARRAADAALQAAVHSDAARGRAEEESRATRGHLASMSHELRTPLGAIQGYTDLLTMEAAGPLTQKQRDYLERIRTASDHLLGLIGEVLDYSRLAAGGLSVDRDVARIGPVVEAALALVEPQAAAKGLGLSNAVSGMAAETRYLGDAGRVRQILINIVGNAVKFTPSGGEVRVSAGAMQSPPEKAVVPGTGPWVYIRVEDNGPGIPEERLEAVFEPFRQANVNDSQKFGGTGLGLAISRRLARLMDGDLTVHSEVGRGSSFFLTLPAATAEFLAPSAAEQRPDATDDQRAQLREDLKNAMLTEADAILGAFVQRLRSDPDTRSAREMSDWELLDNMATFLSAIADTLANADTVKGGEAESEQEGMSIPELLGTQHGMHRYVSGWTEAEVRREFAILREEVTAAVRRKVRREGEEEEEAMTGVTVILDAAERTSLAGYQAAWSRRASDS